MKIFHANHYKNTYIFQILKLLQLNFTKIIKSGFYQVFCEPPNHKTSDFIQNLSSILDLFLKNDDDVALIGDFYLSSDDFPFESFLQAYNLTSLIKDATCFQSSNPSCIDLILTNQKNMYKLSNTFETGISDHRKLISAVGKSGRQVGRKNLQKLQIF